MTANTAIAEFDAANDADADIHATIAAMTAALPDDVTQAIVAELVAALPTTLTLSIRTLRDAHACNIEARIADIDATMGRAVPWTEPIPAHVWLGLPSTRNEDAWFILGHLANVGRLSERAELAFGYFDSIAAGTSMDAMDAADAALIEALRQHFNPTPDTRSAP